MSSPSVQGHIEIINTMNNMIQDSATIMQRRRVAEIVKLQEIWEETGDKLDKWNRETMEMLSLK